MSLDISNGEFGVVQQQSEQVEETATEEGQTGKETNYWQKDMVLRRIFIFKVISSLYHNSSSNLLFRSISKSYRL